MMLQGVPPGNPGDAPKGTVAAVYFIRDGKVVAERPEPKRGDKSRG